MSRGGAEEEMGVARAQSSHATARPASWWLMAAKLGMAHYGGLPHLPPWASASWPVEHDAMFGERPESWGT